MTYARHHFTGEIIRGDEHYMRTIVTYTDPRDQTDSPTGPTLFTVIITRKVGR